MKIIIYIIQFLILSDNDCFCFQGILFVDSLLNCLILIDLS